MTFLQPLLLWGLPLLLLPVLIHLFNRLRHRSMPWAAMMFLRSATRKSTRYARLRQFLILLFRTLAVLGLIMAVSRPLAGGWMGWMMGAAPDVIVMLLDRSASMEARDSAGAEFTKREEALRLLAQSAAGFEQTSRILMIDSVTRKPQEIPVEAMGELPLASATDTSADIPSMLQSAMDWFSQSRPGAGEIWIASDLQESNWDPASDRWPALTGALAALPQGVRIRLLALNREPQGNHSISVRSAQPRRVEGRQELELLFDIHRGSGTSSRLPVAVVAGGVRTTLDLELDGEEVRYRKRVPLPEEEMAGWGYVELPADVNPADNRSYFVYGGSPLLRAVAVGEEEGGIRFLQYATAPNPASTNQSCALIAARELGKVNWEELGLLVWQGPLPDGEAGRLVEGYVEGGGIAIFFPAESGSFQGLGWGEAEQAAEDEQFTIAQWDRREGPLADSDEGLALPLDELVVIQRRGIVGEAAVLASYEDGVPFLVRKSVGNGQVLFCSTLPTAQWSGLADGAVLVPLLQRLLLQGADRFQQGHSLPAGEPLPEDGGEPWTVMAGGEAGDEATRSGVYRSGTRLLAVNRPDRESDPRALDPARAAALFGELPVQLFQEQGGSKARLHSELWRLFLVGMAAFLIVEAFLILPERRVREARAGSGGADREPAPAMAKT